MWLLQECKEYIGFDDRKMVVIGIIGVSLMIHPLLTQMAFLEFITTPSEILTSILWTTVYWVILRGLMIYLRRTLPDISNTPKRILLSTIIVLIIAPILSFCIGHVCNLIFSPQYNFTGAGKYILIYILAFGIMAIYEATFYFHQYN